MVPWIPEADRLSSSCVLEQPNAGPEPRLKAGAQRTLEGVGSRPWLGPVLAPVRLGK